MLSTKKCNLHETNSNLERNLSDDWGLCALFRQEGLPTVGRDGGALGKEWKRGVRHDVVRGELCDFVKGAESSHDMGFIVVRKRPYCRIKGAEWRGQLAFNSC